MLTLNIRSVALIGASEDTGKLGNMILINLLDQFRGEIFPVNPKHDEILGKKCFKDVSSIPGEIDLAVIVTPAPTVLELAEACGKKNVKTLVIISAGFSETGTKEGRDAEAKLRSIAEESGMTILGPNCLGLLLPHIDLNASFAKPFNQKGSIALISQSGAMAVALLDSAASLGLGFSTVFSTGNKATTDEADLLAVLAEDPKTDVIGLYVESIADGMKFVNAARKISLKKPIVLLKAGVSLQGARAVASHTGALAGSTAALDAACHAAGIRRASDTESFLMMLEALTCKRTLPKNAIAVLTNAGGPGVLATDAAERAGLLLPALGNESIATLKKNLPPAASIRNPIDVLGDAGADRYAAALDTAAKDPEIEGLVCLLTPQVMTPCEDIAEAIVKTAKKNPLLPIVCAFMGAESVGKSKAILAGEKIPCAETPERAVNMMAALFRPPRPEKDPIDGSRDDDRASAAAGLLKKKSGHLSDAASSELLALYDLTLPTQEVARSAKEAVRVAEDIGFPVVLKVSAKDILHKTEVGGVKVGLMDAASVTRAYDEIMKNCAKRAPAAGIEGVLVQKHLPAGSEFIVGALRDPAFGPMVMVGLGGIYTELFRDTAFRLAPISKETALTMLTELKSWKLLLGLRGKSRLAIEALADVIVQIGLLIAECDAITEIDLNPVIVGEHNAAIADTRVVLH